MVAGRDLKCPGGGTLVIHTPNSRACPRTQGEPSGDAMDSDGNASLEKKEVLSLQGIANRCSGRTGRGPYPHSLHRKSVRADFGVGVGSGGNVSSTPSMAVHVEFC